MRLKHFLWSLILLNLFVACGSDDSNDNPDPDPDPDPTVELTVSDFEVIFGENPEEGQRLGSIDATTSESTISFILSSQSPEGAISVEESSGRVIVDDPSLFVVDANITASVEVSDGTNDETVAISIDVVDTWSGELITFTKADGADPNNELNQDRITDNVWITRGNSGGQIYNIQTESSANSSTSPAGTAWAQGTIDDLASLTFTPFRDAIRPKDSEGVNLVMHLIQDDVYVSVKFLSWSEGERGGFSYERSTEE